MMSDVLGIISKAMSDLGIEYDIGEYSKTPIVYPYFVGEFTTSEPTTEDGLHEGTFILNGFHRGSWLKLIEAQEKIENRFCWTASTPSIVDDGSAVVVFYVGSQIVPTGDMELKRIQINLQFKEWRVK